MKRMEGSGEDRNQGTRKKIKKDVNLDTNGRREGRTNVKKRLKMSQVRKTMKAGGKIEKEG